jgi:multimeric flavodoxin WrbA
MSTLVIWSSPNTDGLTATAKDSVVGGLKQVGAMVDAIHLNCLKINHCLACNDGWGKCRKQGFCVIKDDFQRLYDAMRASDGIVFITPVYWHDMSENLKCSLDRLRRCETAHNRQLSGKACLLIACAGGTGLGAIQCLERMEGTLSHMGMKAVDRLPIIKFNKQYMFPALAKASVAFASYLAEEGGE